MGVIVRSVEQHVLNMRTRMPFKYGIATLTALPHLFVRVKVDVDGVVRHGIASDGLPPRWFTKDPHADPRDEVRDMMAVIRTACDHALECGETGGACASVFDLWRRVYELQSESWRGRAGVPPLLWAFGVSIVERAVIDGFCRATKTTFGDALRTGRLGMRPGDVHRELAGATLNDLLPAKPLRSVIARHTVGLADPLTDGDIPADERIDDGLPQSLEACIAAYGLSHLKIKLCGDARRDVERLGAIATIASRRERPLAFTLDGNEQYQAVEPFRRLWSALTTEATIATFLRGLLFVEQPFHRDVALTDALGDELRAWTDRPTIIIDESDGALDSAPRALALGYAGTSHKNCKGVFKGVANACLIAQRNRRGGEGARPCVLSGEDLANVGPIALLQDLNVAANLGIEHVERNGHHYFRGLRMLPNDVQAATIVAHGDLYHHHPRGYAAVRIDGGRMKIGSVVDGPLGPAFELDTTRFTPVDQWRYESL